MQVFIVPYAIHVQHESSKTLIDDTKQEHGYRNANLAAIVPKITEKLVLNSEIKGHLSDGTDLTNKAKFEFRIEQNMYCAQLIVTKYKKLMLCSGRIDKEDRRPLML